jgi:preprotein translocase subunit SecE
VEAAIAALPSPAKEMAQIEWTTRPTVRRDSQLVAALGPALGLDAATIDALFIAAADL